MKEVLFNIIFNDIANSENKEFLQPLCEKFIEYYVDESGKTQEKIEILCQKYNSEEIEGYLGGNYFPNEYTHIALLHGIGDFDFYPCLDNDGAIYPYDYQIGLISKDPQIWSLDDSRPESILRYNYHNIIYFTILSLNWMKIRGNQYGVIVKTLQNNSTSAFYLNDFAFNEDSKFHMVKDWRQAVKNYNKDSIEIDKLFETIKQKYDR